MPTYYKGPLVTWAYFNRKPIHDVRINGEGFGGGEFRRSERSTVELSDGSDPKKRAREDPYGQNINTIGSVCFSAHGRAASVRLATRSIDPCVLWPPGVDFLAGRALYWNCDVRKGGKYHHLLCQSRWDRRFLKRALCHDVGHDAFSAG
jgi:hypothetical protein